MKKLFYTLLLIMPLGFTACTLRPVADFYVDDMVVNIGERVWFTNESYNASDYEWDFGDGTWTDEENPVHTFNASGTYEVVLTAYSRKGVTDEAAITITVQTPTILEVEVFEWNEDWIADYPINEEANIRLYPSLADWEAQENLVIEANTTNGKVVFWDLEQTYYLLDVWSPNYNNFGVKADDPGLITTPVLVPNEINYFIAWVDYAPSDKKGTSNERDRSLVVRKIERVPKKK